MCPGLHYDENTSSRVEAFPRVDLVSLNEDHRNFCNHAPFDGILNDKNHSLRYLLPPLHKAAGINFKKHEDLRCPWSEN